MRPEAIVKKLLVALLLAGCAGTVHQPLGPTQANQIAGDPPLVRRFP